MVSYKPPKQYPYLPEGRQIKYISQDHPFMKEARKAQQKNSTEKLNPIGVVLVRNEKVILRAGNQSILKNQKMVELHKKYCLRRLLKVPSGKAYWLCPGCASPEQHAEAQLIKKARKQNIDTRDADIYMYGHWWCCQDCWNKMIKAEIRNIYHPENAYNLFARK